jgi:threonylcarbamoyladenosine tRNA methylthiotransferase MtaB
VRTVAITTLGCKVNQYDSEAIAAQFRKAGFEVVPFEDVADVYVINTCTVTQMGDKKSRQFIRRAHSRNPDALIVAAGCYAQASPSEVAALPGVCVVSGTYERGRIVQAVLNFERSSRPCRLDVDGAEADRTGLEQRSVAPEVLVRETRSFGAFEELPAEGWAERTRAYVKIEDGCENFCSYCKVPYVRGPVRSRDPLRICREIELLASLGYREVVLTGIDLGAYGRDFGGSPDLAEILEAAAKVEGIARVRLSSVDPTDVTERLINVMADCGGVCPHLHIPLQSGSGRVLSLMNRRYTVSEYEDIVSMARERIADLAVTTDVIVGFPGEDEEDFLATCDVCKRSKFSRMHVFQYSRRKGTVASRLPGQVPRAEKARRSAKLIALGGELSLGFHRQLLGRSMSVLVEQADNEGFEGLTGNYVRVYAVGSAFPGDMVDVCISEADEGFVRGSIEEVT